MRHVNFKQFQDWHLKIATPFIWCHLFSAVTGRVENGWSWLEKNELRQKCFFSFHHYQNEESWFPLGELLSSSLLWATKITLLQGRVPSKQPLPLRLECAVLTIDSFWISESNTISPFIYKTFYGGNIFLGLPYQWI